MPHNPQPVQHQFKEPPNQKNELHEQIKNDIRKFMEGIDKKEDFLKAIQGLLRDPNNGNDLKKIEEMLNEEASKKAVT